MTAGSVSGSLRTHEWVPPLIMTSVPSARRAASTAVRYGTAMSRSPWMTNDGHLLVGRAPRACRRCPASAGSRSAGPSSRQGRRTWPTRVGPTSRPSFAAWRGLRRAAASRACRWPAATATPTSTRRGEARHVDHPVPGVADDRVDEDDGDGPVGVAPPPAGRRAGRPSSGRRRRPGGCPARRAPGRAGRRRRRVLAPPVGRPWVPPWPATSIATTLKPMRTRRDSVWA